MVAELQDSPVIPQAAKSPSKFSSPNYHHTPVSIFQGKKGKKLSLYKKEKVRTRIWALPALAVSTTVKAKHVSYKDSHGNYRYKTDRQIGITLSFPPSFLPYDDHRHTVKESHCPSSVCVHACRDVHSLTGPPQAPALSHMPLDTPGQRAGNQRGQKRPGAHFLIQTLL